MENSNHKGSEFNNIIETWEQNEKKKENESSGRIEDTPANETLAQNDLEQLIKKEAVEYDNVNKEDRVLSGDRATINDEADTSEK